MPLIAIGALETNGLLGRLIFAPYAFRAMTAARRAEGCLLADARSIDGLQFSLTAWKDEASMKSYALGAGHAPAMRALRRIGPSHGFHRYESADLPPWEDALARWRASRK